MASSIAAVALIAALAFGAATTVRSALLDRGDDQGQALAGGPPAPPISVAPVECPGACFDAESVRLLKMEDADFQKLGADATAVVPASPEGYDASLLYEKERGNWWDANGSPDSCFFFQTSAPHSVGLDPINTMSDDSIFFMGTHEAGTGFADQSVRIFETSQAAEAHLTGLFGSILECERVSIGESFTASITLAPAFDVPDDIAIVGWVHTANPGTRWRGYVVDMQVSNAVVRLRLVTDGSISEERFRTAVESYALQLSLNAP